MTTFVLSHNLQVLDPKVPALDFADLASALLEHCASVASAEALSHPHWKVKLESNADAEVLAGEITSAWRTLRGGLGHDTNHVVMALGGRKDSEGLPGAPLQQGGWGVDVVETADPEGFLKAINWTGLTAGRADDAVFEVSSFPS